MMYPKHEFRMACFTLPLAWLGITLLSYIWGAEYGRCDHQGKALSAAIDFNLAALAAYWPYVIWQNRSRPAALIAAVCCATAWNIYLLSVFWHAEPDCLQSMKTGLEHLGQIMVLAFADVSAAVFSLLALWLLWRKPCILQHSVWSAVSVVCGGMAATLLLIWILLKIGLS